MGAWVRVVYQRASESLIRRFKGNEVTFESFPERTFRLVEDP